MKLYMKQKVFSWGDKFTIKDESEADKFTVEGEVFSWGHKLHVYNTAAEEIAFVQQKVFSFLPRYFLYIGGVEKAQLVKEFTFFTPRYRLEGTNWTLEGNFMAHDYILSDGERTIMTVTKEWFTWGDSYQLDIANSEDELLCLSIVLAVDCVLEDARRSSGAH